MADQPPSRPDQGSFIAAMRAVSPYLDLGMTFVVAIGGGVWLGLWADKRWETSPWLVLAGALLGMVAGFYHFFSVVLRKPDGDKPGGRLD